MAKRPAPTISASLALSALTEACEEVRKAEQALAASRANRDNLIRDAREARIPYPYLMTKTRLSREHLARIVSSADITSPEGVSRS